MAEQILEYTYHLKGGEEEAVERNNPFPERREPIVVYCRDGKTRIKIGDGVHRYNELEFVGAIESGNSDIIKYQADWNQNDSSKVDYIKNKPNIPSIEGLATREYVDNSTQQFANALKGNAIGSAIALTDVSPFEHTLKVNARSNNIFPDFITDRTYTNGSFVRVNSDKSITIHKTAGDRINFSTKAYLPKGTYTISSGYGASRGVYIQINNTTTINYGYATFTLEQDTECEIILYSENTVALDEDITFKPQLVLGTVLPPYTPYIADITSAKVQRYRKSLFEFNYISTSRRIETTNMILPIQNQVFALSINKTPSEWGLILEYENGSIVNKSIGFGVTKYFFKFDGDILRIGSTSNVGATTELGGKIKRFGIWAYGTITNGWDTEPLAQVELNTEATEYEPYTEPTTYPISTDGTVEGITSLYPTTTLTSDTEGVVLDVEYNRDINKAFAELVQAIISIGGNV